MYCVQDTYPKWSNTTLSSDLRTIVTRSGLIRLTAHLPADSGMRQPTRWPARPSLDSLPRPIQMSPMGEDMVTLAE